MLDLEESFSMIVALPFCQSDLPLLRSNLELMQFLGGCQNHDAMVIVEEGVNWDEAMDILVMARKTFKSAVMLSPVERWKGWPAGPNSMFLTAAKYAQSIIKPFLFMEPDCIPLKARWLEDLEAEYLKLNKPFMGFRVLCNKPGLPDMSLAGNAVYPACAMDIMGERIKANPRIAFDVSTSNEVVPLTAFNHLIHHFWGQKNMAPTFARTKTSNSSINTFTLETIHSRAVLFHRCKDGSLTRILMGKTEQTIADYVSLRRSGDILNVLPLMEFLSKKKKRKMKLVVHRDFMPILEGVSYVEGIPWDGHWEDPLAAATHHRAVNLQVFGKHLHPDTIRGNFARMAWEQAGYQWNRYLPLTFDQRNLQREQELAALVFKTDNPKILVKTEGLSSPFPHGAQAKRMILDAFGSQAEVVDLDSIHAERIYDLLGLMDQSACLVTVDTSTLWLARASRCPVVAFVNGTGFGGSPEVGNMIIRIPYPSVMPKWNQVSEAIRSTLDARNTGKGIVLVYSDFKPNDVEIQKRQDKAFSTWDRLGAIHIPFVTRRSSAQIGDSRSMPFVRDMIESAIDRNPEIIAITNNDIQFDPLLGLSVRRSCEESGCFWCYRLDAPGGKTDEGADFFAFTPNWWRAHSRLFPDFLLGYYWWDDILVRIMRWSGCKEQDRLYYHDPHPGVSNRLNSPGNAYNEKLARAWLSEHRELHEKPHYG